MKGLYLVLLLAGNLFSQTATEAIISDSMVTDGIIFHLFEATDVTDFTYGTDITYGNADVTFTVMEFQDCKGDDLMFNYVSGQIQEINLLEFGDRQASYFFDSSTESVGSISMDAEKSWRQVHDSTDG